MKSLEDRFIEVCSVVLESADSTSNPKLAVLTKRLEKIKAKIDELNERMDQYDKQENRQFMPTDEWQEKKTKLLKEQAELYKQMKELEKSALKQ